MARKPLKLTKNALMLLGIIALLLITFLVLKFGGTKSEQPEKKVTETLSGLVVENQVLKVQLLDFVSNKDFDKSSGTHKIDNWSHHKSLIGHLGRK